jgi:hypothetical protein
LASPAVGYLGGLDTLAGSSRRGGNDSFPGILNPTAPGSLRDLNAAVDNQWNPLYSPPKLEPSKVSPPTSTTVEVPRRRF